MWKTISAGDYQATIVSEGAGLASLTYQGNDLVLPHPPTETPDGYSGKLLLPWPNRVAGGQYQWGEKTQQLEINEPARSAALHGLVAHEDWHLTDSSPSHVTFETKVGPAAGYPFHLLATATYSLSADEGLTLTVTTENIGDEAAPYGASFHPYLTCGVPADECTISLPAQSVAEVDVNLTPTGVVAVSDLLDLRGEAHLRGRQLDHAFTGLPEGQWSVTLADPASGRGVEMRSSARWAQVFLGDVFERMGVAVEPMTCPPDAFNSGVDLIVLQPGEQTVFTTSIQAVSTKAANSDPKETPSN